MPEQDVGEAVGLPAPAQAPSPRVWQSLLDSPRAATAAASPLHSGTRSTLGVRAAWSPLPPHGHCQDSGPAALPPITERDKASGFPV